MPSHTSTLSPAIAPSGAPQPATLPPLMLPKRPRPSALHGVTYRKETPLGTAFITVNRNGGDEPFEVFLNVGKAGSDVAAVSEALGRLVSLILRLPSPLTAVERLKQIIDQLAGIGGGRVMGFGAKRVRSLPDAVAQVLREYLSDEYGSDEENEEEDEESGARLPAPAGLGPAVARAPAGAQPKVAPHVRPVAEQLALPIAERPIGDLCPDCGQASFIATEGCRKCYVCGYSEC